MRGTLFVNAEQRFALCFAFSLNTRAVSGADARADRFVPNLVRGQSAAHASDGDTRDQKQLSLATRGSGCREVARPVAQKSAKRDRVVGDPETDVAPGLPEAAIRVQNIDAQCVLQFTLLLAASCVLHRRPSRVIHR